MKEFRKNNKDKFVCEECGKEFKYKKTLSYHINKLHHLQKYYNKWIKENDEGLCKICNKETKFTGFKYGYKNTCCKEHDEIWNHIQIKKSNMKKYGVESTFELSEIRKKIKIAKKEKYDDENFNNKEKTKNTCLEVYGVENVFQSKTVKEKCKQTMLKNHGVEHALKSKKLQEKFKQTNLKNHGVEYPMQNKDLFKKQQKATLSLCYFKNTDIYYRGSYELDFLEKYLNLFPDIINGPTIRYVFEDKTRIYYPDFYIPSLNLIIEIKNSYLINRYRKQINAKEKAVINNNFKYIIIIDKNYVDFINYLVLNPASL